MMAVTRTSPLRTAIRDLALDALFGAALLVARTGARSSPGSGVTAPLAKREEQLKGMAKKQAPAAKQKGDKLKVSKKLFKAFKKEAKKKDLAISALALEISERGIRKRGK